MCSFHNGKDLSNKDNNRNLFLFLGGEEGGGYSLFLFILFLFHSPRLPSRLFVSPSLFPSLIAPSFLLCSSFTSSQIKLSIDRRITACAPPFERYVAMTGDDRSIFIVDVPRMHISAVIPAHDDWVAAALSISIHTPALLDEEVVLVSLR